MPEPARWGCGPSTTLGLPELRRQKRAAEEAGIYKVGYQRGELWRRWGIGADVYLGVPSESCPRAGRPSSGWLLQG